MDSRWDWQWEWGRNSINVTFGLLNLAFGFSVTHRDLVLYLGMFTVIIESWPELDDE